MLQKLKNRITLVASVLIVAGGMPLAIGTSTAHAFPDECQNYCYDYCAVNSSNADICINAWGGGPRVNGSSNGYLANGGFQFIGVGGGNSAIQFIPPGGDSDSPYNGDCVGDYNNNSSDATTGLDACPPGSGAGWGTNFTYTDCVDNNGYYCYGFHDNHWNGYLGPNSWTNGDHFYLNKPNLNCLIPIEQVHS